MGMMFAINSRVAVRKICFKQKLQNVMVLPLSLFCFSTRWSGGRSLQLRTFFQSPGYIRTPSAFYLVGLLTLLAVMLKYHFRDFVFTFWVAFIPISSYVIRIWVFMSFSTDLSLACFGFCQFNLRIIGCQICKRLMSIFGFPGSLLPTIFVYALSVLCFSVNKYFCTVVFLSLHLWDKHMSSLFPNLVTNYKWKL